MRTLTLFLLLCLGVVIPALAAGIDGEWEGEVEGRNGMQHMVFSFKQDGGTLTGKVTGPRGDNPIVDGKVDGDQISFTTPVNFGGNSATIIYSGKINGDEIAFKREIKEFNRTSEFTAKRKK